MWTLPSDAHTRHPQTVRTNVVRVHLHPSCCASDQRLLHQLPRHPALPRPRGFLKPYVVLSPPSWTLCLSPVPPTALALQGCPHTHTVLPPLSLLLSLPLTPSLTLIVVGCLVRRSGPLLPVRPVPSCVLSLRTMLGQWVSFYLPVVSSTSPLPAIPSRTTSVRSAAYVKHG